MRRYSAFIFVVLLVSYAYFHSATCPNPNTRYDLARAIVEKRSLCIDDYHENTIDKARFDGHVYADKAPGSSLLAVPPYWAGYHVARVLYGREIARESPAIQLILFYIIQVVCAGIPGALLGALMFHVLCTVFRPARPEEWAAAFLATFTIGLGTSVFAYSTLLYGHVLAALFLFAAVYLLGEPESPGRVALSGVCAGMGTLTEFTLLPAYAIAAFVRFCFHKEKAAFARRLLLAVAGGAPFALILLGYNWAVTGSPFTLAYENVAPRFQQYMSRGLYGVALPDLGVLLSLLGGPYRGLFLLSPALLAVFGVWDLWVRQRPVFLTSVLIILYYLLTNSAYGLWWGGASTYPRHMTAAMPFFIFFIYSALNSKERVLMRVLCAVTILNGLVIIATMPQVLERVLFPLPYLYKKFFGGHLGIAFYWEPFMNGIPREFHSGWNWGMVVGLPGALSLVPLLAFWAGAIAWLRRDLRRRTLDPREEYGILGR